MTDPNTVGMLVVSVLSTIGDAVLKGVVSESVKDSYTKLKEFIAPVAAHDLTALEQSPNSPARKAIVAEAIDALPIPDQAEVRSLAMALIAIFEVAPTYPIGVDVNKLKAILVELDSIKVSREGRGARFGAVETETFRVGKIEVGSPQGKLDK